MFLYLFSRAFAICKSLFLCKENDGKVAEGCDLVILRLPSTTAFAVWDSIKSCFPYAIEGVADCYDIYQNSSSLLHKILWYRMHCKMLEASHKAMGISCVTRNYMQNIIVHIGKIGFFLIILPLRCWLRFDLEIDTIYRRNLGD